MMNVSRRGLITGLTAFIAAPAIVRASSLMPVKSIHDYNMSKFVIDTWYRSSYNPKTKLWTPLEKFVDIRKVA